MNRITALYHVLALLLIGAFAPGMRADEPSWGFATIDHFTYTEGDKVAGHIGAALMERGGKPVACFGVDKELDGEPVYLYFIVFNSGDKQLQAEGSAGRLDSNGVVTKIVEELHLGPVKLPLILETTRDEATKKITKSKVVVGDQELPEKGPRVVVADFSGEKPAYHVIKVDLPASVIDLSDNEHTTWPKAVDAAIAELKEKSPELKKLAD
jgi:hypothetical protein